VIPSIGLRIRRSDGTLAGTALIYKPAAGMTTLATMAAQSDLAHLARMQVVAQPARRPAARRRSASNPTASGTSPLPISRQRPRRPAATLQRSPSASSDSYPNPDPGSGKPKPGRRWVRKGAKSLRNLALGSRSRHNSSSGCVRAATGGTRAFRPSQQPTASRSVRHTCAIRGLDKDAMRRLKDARGTVWMLSKLTTHGVGTPSSLGVNSSSDTKPRCVLVRAATTTEPMRSATGSRVSTSTGRSPPGVAANQISPRCIAPLSPILSRPPVSNLLKRALRISERHLLPRLDIMLATEAYKVSMKSVAKDLRALHPQSFGPPLDLSSLDLRDTKTKHRHTEEDITYDTRRAPVTAPLVALTSGVSRHATRQRRTLRRPQSGIPPRVAHRSQETSATSASVRVRTISHAVV
jgi:hypothetical protein